jgi:hypothetical protein
VTIEGKVARIINERELAINRGSGAGVVKGMKFKVMEPRVTIIDPETYEELGTLEREKIRVAVSEVFPKYSIARTFETYVTDDPNVSGFLSLTMRRVTRVRTLRTEEGVTQSPGTQVASVNVGDLVVEAIGEI